MREPLGGCEGRATSGGLGGQGVAAGRERERDELRLSQKCGKEPQLARGVVVVVSPGGFRCRQGTLCWEQIIHFFSGPGGGVSFLSLRRPILGSWLTAISGSRANV